MASLKSELKIPCNTIDLIYVKKRLLFVQDERTGSFVVKLMINNMSPRFISFMVRPSNSSKFCIKPRYGSISPGHSSEVIILTNQEHVKCFNDISLESFSVFAVRVYDKRQLERKSLSVLWKALGTDLFPYEAVEHHKINCILPKSDTYLKNLSILERIPYSSHFTTFLSKRQDEYNKPSKEALGIREEEFFAMWPSHNKTFSQMKKDEDPGLDEMIEDWHILGEKVHLQTKALVDTFHHLVATFAFTISTVLGLALWHGNGTICLWNCNSCECASNADTVIGNDEDVIMSIDYEQKESEGYFGQIWGYWFGGK